MGAPEDRSGPEEVRVTIVVEQGRVEDRARQVRQRGAPVRAGLVSAGLDRRRCGGSNHRCVVGWRRRSQVIGRFLAVAGGFRRFGDAVRPSIELRTSSRLSYLTAHTPGSISIIPVLCGTFGNQVTLILHRVDGVWVREFEASSCTCPIRQLPEAVATELRLCGRVVVPSRPVPRSPSGVV